jgi:hypothetical protein
VVLGCGICIYYTEASEELSNSDVFVEAKEAQIQSLNAMSLRLLQRELAYL